MKPRQAIEELSTMPGDRNKVTTKRLQKIITVLASHINVLETDNRKLRTKYRNQRKKTEILKDRIRWDEG